MDYGTFLIQNNNKTKGFELYQKSHKIYMNNLGLKHPSTSQCFLRFGDFYFEQNNIIKALQYYQKALIANVQDFNDTNIYVNPYSEKILLDNYLLETLKKKAKALSCLANSQINKKNKIKALSKSLETYEIAVNLIQKIRFSFSTEESKLFLMENEKNTLIHAIHTALALYEETGILSYKTKAFEFAEKSKATILLASLRNNDAMIFGGIPDSLQNIENEIIHALSSYKNFIFKEKEKQNPDKNKITLWEEKVFNLNIKQDKLIAYLENKFPSYYELKYNSKIINISDIQTKLNNNTALLEYVISDTLLYIFTITSDKFEVYTSQLDSSFNKNIQTIIKFLTVKNLMLHISGEYREFIDAAYNLYCLLIKPSVNSLMEKDIIIIPDGKLAYIPFDILIYSKTDKEIQFNNLSYLLKKHAIGYSYSATLYFKDYSAYKKKSKNVLAFAPTYKNRELLTLSEHNERVNLDPIPGAIEEINLISDFFNTDICKDHNATEEKFKALAHNYNILHLAMHAIIDNENPMFSKLVFSDNNDSIEDGFLNTYEIYGMKLNANMAVLSACNTGYGKLQQGEGIMSLSRGFLYAGCPAIIMTLWTIEDNSSLEIMKNFYSYLSDGKNKLDALRLAKLDFLKNSDPLKSHPYFWAAYINIGDISPVTGSNITNNNYIYLFSLIIILIIFGIIRRKNV
ncbi:MAG: CHAT domain-containing protein [Bacteroidales bacterium]|nr:CHAT domain-containing protein [Bacteroidales bacterium]